MQTEPQLMILCIINKSADKDKLIIKLLPINFLN